MSSHSPIRRVVTGHNDDGRSVIEIDGLAPQRYDSPDVPGFGATVVWWTADEVDLAKRSDPAPGGIEVPMAPPTGGSIFRIADFPPDAVYSPEAIARMFGEMHGEHAQADGVAHGDARHFWFHRTQSLDYAIVLSGEITLLVDDGETTLRTGDVVVQRATNHAWSNRSGEICRMLFVLMGTPPVSPTELVRSRTTPRSAEEL